MATTAINVASDGLYYVVKLMAGAGHYRHIQFRRKLTKDLLLGLFIGVLGVLASLTPLGIDLEENFGLSWLFQFRGTISAPHEVVVVAIDKASANQLDLPSMPSLWPRNLHAQLIENLSEAGAQVIVFDLRFDTPGNQPEYDVELANAMYKAGNVVIVERLDREELPLTGQVDRAYSGSLEKPAGLLPIIADAAAAHTVFPLPRTSRVNEYWVFKPSAGGLATLPAVVLQLFALDAYEDFVRLLRNASPLHAAELPDNKSAVVVEDLILTLRLVFTNEPWIAQHMLIALDRDSTLDPRNKRLIQSLLSLYTEDSDTRYLNFYGPPRSIQTIPYYQALQPTPNSESEPMGNDFKGKVVFVGFSAATQPEQDRVRDDYHTVFSRSDGLYISGVEIAATAFVNLLEDRPVRPLAPIPSVSLIFLWGFVIALGYTTLSHRSLATLSLGLVCLSIGLAFIYVFVTHYQFKEGEIWLPLVVPLFIQVPAALVGALSLKYYGSRQEYKALKEAFGKFLPERVISELTMRPDSVTSNNHLVYGTCLATDAEMYTTLAEYMDPTQLGRLMNEYYATMFEPVSRYEGIVSDVVGDAMLAIWSASSENEALRQKACLASLDIVDALVRFNKVKRPRLPTRIGLHSGEMFLGTVGALNHYEYRAVGDMVNTTNRIQGLNKYLGTHLLVSDKVVEGLDDFLTRPMGVFLLAGKTSSVRVVELMTRRQEASSEQIWLCEIFAHAMRAYELQEWATGCHNFSEILKAFPDDGPARFYLKRCQDYRVMASIGPWDSPLTDRRKVSRKDRGQLV